MVDSKSVKDYRTLRFESYEDARRELDSLEAANRAGTIRASGNWTPGQVFSHLAAFMDYPYDGYPPVLKPPSMPLRLILRTMKRRFMNKGLPRGLFISGVPGGTVGAADVSFDEGIARLRRSMDRAEKSLPSIPNLVFGPMTGDEWNALQRRHCELHLGYLLPR